MEKIVTVIFDTKEGALEAVEQIKTVRSRTASIILGKLVSKMA